MNQIITPETQAKFAQAVETLDRKFESDSSRLDDTNTNSELRAWLQGKGSSFPWTKNAPDVTSDEWFFITTLWGEMTLAGQRTHIRAFFPKLFVDAAQRDIRNFVPNMPQYVGLRSGWMKTRLSTMGCILRDRDLTMAEYVVHLGKLEGAATPDNPMPALDAIIADHKSTGWKTLSCFVRDCVCGNSFPIDTRVAKELAHWKLAANERHLVSLSLSMGRNPRPVARMFYEAGGKEALLPNSKT